LSMKIVYCLRTGLIRCPTSLSGRVMPSDRKNCRSCSIRHSHVTMSRCHDVTMSRCHDVTMSRCHDVTMSRCHDVTMSRCHVESPRIRFLLKHIENLKLKTLNTSVVGTAEKNPRDVSSVFRRLGCNFHRRPLSSCNEMHDIDGASSREPEDSAPPQAPSDSTSPDA